MAKHRNLMHKKGRVKHETASSKTEGDRKERELSGEPRSGPHLGESKQVCNVAEPVVKEGGEDGEEQNRHM